MTRKVYNVGGGRHSEAALSALLSQLLEGDVARGLNIEPTGSAGLSVRITAGTGQIRVSQFHSRIIQSDAAETTTAVPAPTSNPRRNLVVAYIDPAVTPTTSVVDNTNGVFKFAVIQGAEAATPQIPTNTAVTAALGTENWIPLGDFRTNVGATSVVLANITDQRRMILVTSDKIDFTSFLSFKATRTTTNSAPGGTWYSYNPTTADWNIGSAFNTSSAVFTAPVAGIYRFDASIFLGAGSSNWGALRLNINSGSKLLDLISLQMTRVLTVQGGTEVKLNAGDTVKVEGYTATTVDVNNPASWFSGRLIQLS